MRPGTDVWLRPGERKGLRIRSFGRATRSWRSGRPEPHHLAFEGVLNGGICGTLLDCHSNWTAAIHLMRAVGSRQASLHGDGRLPREVEAADAHRGTAQAEGARRRVGRGPRGGRGRDRGRRQGHGHLPRDLRRREGRAPRLSPLVIRHPMRAKRITAARLFVLPLAASMLSTASPAFSASARANHGAQRTVVSRDNKRTYAVYAPDSVKADARAPLIVAIHGSTSNGKAMVERWTDIADKHGVLIAGPDATDNSRWASPGRPALPEGRRRRRLHALRDRRPPHLPSGIRRRQFRSPDGGSRVRVLRGRGRPRGRRDRGLLFDLRRRDAKDPARDLHRHPRPVLPDRRRPGDERGPQETRVPAALQRDTRPRPQLQGRHGRNQSGDLEYFAAHPLPTDPRYTSYKDP